MNAYNSRPGLHGEPAAGVRRRSAGASKHHVFGAELPRAPRLPVVAEHLLLRRGGRAPQQGVQRGANFCTGLHSSHSTRLRCTSLLGGEQRRSTAASLCLPGEQFIRISSI